MLKQCHHQGKRKCGTGAQLLQDLLTALLASSLDMGRIANEEEEEEEEEKEEEEDMGRVSAQEKVVWLQTRFSQGQLHLQGLAHRLMLLGLSQKLKPGCQLTLQSLARKEILVQSLILLPLLQRR
jgi:hypothetical protein